LAVAQAGGGRFSTSSSAIRCSSRATRSRNAPFCAQCLVLRTQLRVLLAQRGVLGLQFANEGQGCFEHHALTLPASPEGDQQP
jgi:hypothetical protein